MNATCHYRTIEDVDVGHLLAIDPTPIGRFLQVDSERRCAAICFGEPRCHVALYSRDKLTSEPTGLPKTDGALGCLLFGVTLDLITLGPTAPLPRAEHGGATLIYEIFICDGSE